MPYVIEVRLVEEGLPERLADRIERHGGAREPTLQDEEAPLRVVRIGCGDHEVRPAVARQVDELLEGDGTVLACDRPGTEAIGVQRASGKQRA